MNDHDHGCLLASTIKKTALDWNNRKTNVREWTIHITCCLLLLLWSNDYPPRHHHNHYSCIVNYWPSLSFSLLQMFMCWSVWFFFLYWIRNNIIMNIQHDVTLHSLKSYQSQFKVLIDTKLHREASWTILILSLSRLF